MRHIRVNKVYSQLLAFLASEAVFLNLVSWSPIKLVAFGILILVPGTFFSYLIKIPKLILWPSRVAFSLILFMLIGLILNTGLPFIHIITPLKVVYLLPSITLVTLLLAWLALKRGTNRVQRNPNKITVKIAIMLTLFLLMLIAAVLGTIRLNNGSGNQLTMIAFGGLAILNLIAIFILKKSERYIFPLILYITGLSVLLMFSLRSAYAVGWDIQTELHVFNLTASNHRWLISNDNNVYNATLSLTILPTIFKEFLHVSSETIFKLYYPILTATLGPIVYAIARKLSTNRQAFLAALFFVIQGEFIQQLPALARQEIAYIFFALLLFYIFDKSLSNQIKKIFIIILGIAMIVSHYSTAYVGLGVLLIGAVVFRIIMSCLKTPDRKEKSFISVKILAALLLVTFFWYGQISNGSGGLITAIDTSFKNLITENSQEQKSIVAQEVLFGKPQSNITLVDEYSKNVINKQLSPNGKTLLGGNLVSAASVQSVPIKSSLLAKANSTITFISLKSFKLFLILGVIIGMFQIIRHARLKVDYPALYSVALGFSLLLLAITLFPSLSLFYNFERMYQQSLMILGVVIMLGGSMLLSYILRKKIYALIVISILIAGYFFSYSGFLTEITGGDPNMQLANYGTAYDEYYQHNGEILAGQWLVNTKRHDQSIATDVFGQVKLNRFYNTDKQIYNNLIVHILDKNTYIYETYTNRNLGVELEQYNNQIVAINFPTSIINNQKSLLYTNGDSSIYY